MEEVLKYWTQAEQGVLFQQYFDGLNVYCPKCAERLAFRMVHTREVVALSAHCDGCANTAVLLFAGLIGLRSEWVSHSG